MPLAGIESHTSNFCRHFSSKSVYNQLLHSIFSAVIFFSDLRSQAQNNVNEAWWFVIKKVISTSIHWKLKSIIVSTLSRNVLGVIVEVFES